MAIGRWSSAGLAFVAIVLLTGPGPAAPSGSDEGFVPLFDGKDLAHWVVPKGDNGHWKVVDGVIDYDARSEAPGEKHLVTSREFGDFILKFDWRIKETPFINPNVYYVL